MGTADGIAEGAALGALDGLPDGALLGGTDVRTGERMYSGGNTSWDNQLNVLNSLPTVTEMLPGVPSAMSGLINNLTFSTWLGSRACSAEIWVLVSKNSAVISRVTPND